MHSALTLTETGSQNEDLHDQKKAVKTGSQDPEEVDTGQGGELSLPALTRDGDASSIPTNTSNATSATLTPTETVATARIGDQPPILGRQAVFSAKDGSDIAQRRGTRRRTGPLSAQQREKAAMIRKLGACHDCRRRRVACHPNHHNMTWEDAAKIYRSHSPGVPELAPLPGRPLTPTPSSTRRTCHGHDAQEMDVDTFPLQPSRPLGETHNRTPLPSGPRTDKAFFTPPEFGADGFRYDFQGMASRILSNPSRSRYALVQALMLQWQDDEDPGARVAMDEFCSVIDQLYHFAFKVRSIPTSSESCKNSWRWLSREVNDFVEQGDQRDVLKIVYYNGHTYLDGNREMVLARFVVAFTVRTCCNAQADKRSDSSKTADPGSAIRWSGIQQSLENASCDVLMIMDSAYYPSSKMVRNDGVLELIAASASEDHVRFLGRSAFTRALTEQLRTRASQKFINNPLSAAELHAKLLSSYPKMIQDRNPEQEMVLSFPSPLHMQISGNAKLPSVLLAPMQKAPPIPLPESPTTSTPQMCLTFRLSDDMINSDSWAEWLRSIPDGVTEVKVEGPYRTLCR